MDFLSSALEYEEQNMMLQMQAAQHKRQMNEISNRQKQDKKEVDNKYGWNQYSIIKTSEEEANMYRRTLMSYARTAADYLKLSPSEYGMNTNEADPKFMEHYPTFWNDYQCLLQLLNNHMREHIYYSARIRECPNLQEADKKALEMQTWHNNTFKEFNSKCTRMEIDMKQKLEEFYNPGVQELSSSNNLVNASSFDVAQEGNNQKSNEIISKPQNSEVENQQKNTIIQELQTKLQNSEVENQQKNTIIQELQTKITELSMRAQIAEIKFEEGQGKLQLALDANKELKKYNEEKSDIIKDLRLQLETTKKKYNVLKDKSNSDYSKILASQDKHSNIEDNISIISFNSGGKAPSDAGQE